MGVCLPLGHLPNRTPVGVWERGGGGGAGFGRGGGRGGGREGTILARSHFTSALFVYTKNIQV